MEPNATTDSCIRLQQKTLYRMTEIDKLWTEWRKWVAMNYNKIVTSLEISTYNDWNVQQWIIRFSPFTKLHRWRMIEINKLWKEWIKWAVIIIDCYFFYKTLHRRMMIEIDKMWTKWIKNELFINWQLTSDDKWTLNKNC